MIPEDLPVLQDQVLRLTFGGDIMAHAPNWKMADFDQIYARVKDLLQADDLTFGNLEFPVDPTRAWATYPAFNVHPSYVEAAIRGGFDIFSLANNHSNDHGPEAIRQTLLSMEELGSRYPIGWNGVRAQETDPWEPLLIERKGIRMGFVSMTNLLNSLWARQLVHFVPWIDYWTNQVSIKQQKALLDQVALWKLDYDLLILALHDGVEYATRPTTRQEAFYRDLTRAGVDILWAHHPHVLQPWEWRDLGDRQALILYSMGNFISGQIWNLGPQDSKIARARTGDGALVQVEVHRWGRQVTLRNPRALLLNNHKIPEVGMVVAPTDHWLEGASTPHWQAYYQHRLEEQTSFLTPWITSHP